MEFSIKAVEWKQSEQIVTQASKSDCWVVGVFATTATKINLTGLAKYLDQHSGGAITRIVKSGDFSGKRGSSMNCHGVLGAQGARVLLVGLGNAAEYDASVASEAQRTAAKALLATQSTQVMWGLLEHSATKLTLADQVLLTAQTIREQAYDFIANFPQLKLKREKATASLKKVVLLVASSEEKSAKLALQQGVAVANGMGLAKNLANLPANICTPTYLAQTAKDIAKAHKLKVEVLGRKQIEALKMGAFLAVAQGTEQAPQFIVLKYQGTDAKKAPIVLIGKGITFDTGGISLKPGEGMDEMKYDMCGAASVLGTIQAAAEMGLKQNVIAVIPTCENMPSGHAIKPGDVVTSMSGQTIEILNTDAEGRLILCDALTYVERFKPAAVIDVATLTGACVIALGHVHSGLFSADEKLVAELSQASKASLDTAWHMPLDASYQEQLKSNFADMANIGGRPAGSVTAACFLARYTKAYPWAHLDIAGTAWKSGAAKGATGRPVPLLTRFLINRT